MYIFIVSLYHVCLEVCHDYDYNYAIVIVLVMDRIIWFHQMSVVVITAYHTIKEYVIILKDFMSSII